MGTFDHSSRGSFVRSDRCWTRRPGSVSALIHPKGVLSGWGQDSVQASQVPPHQIRSSMSLWPLLCAPEFIYLFMAVLGLRFCARALSSCGKRGHSSSRCAGLPPPRPLPLRSTGSRRAGSAVVAHGPSRSAACGILPDQGSNPCPLHRQADPQPLRHQGSPYVPVDQ